MLLHDRVQVNRKKIIVDHSKKSALSTPGYKNLRRRLTSLYRVEEMEEFNMNRIADWTQLVILGCPEVEYREDELDCLYNYVTQLGGNLLIFGSEHSKKHVLNDLLQMFDIELKSNCIIRSVYSYKEYFHPKQAFIEKPCLHTLQSAGNSNSKKINNIVYPYGCSISYDTSDENRNIPLLSSMDLCFPSHECLALLKKGTSQASDPMNMNMTKTRDETGGGVDPTTTLGRGCGNVIVVGSVEMFHDLYINSHDNLSFLLQCVEYLMAETDTSVSNGINSTGGVKPTQNESKIAEKEKVISNIEEIAKRVQPCLEGPDDLPEFDQLFKLSQYSLTNNKLCDVIKLYDKLHIKHEPLSLISPQFEIPLPPLKPAVFPPTFLFVNPPALELFDIDAELANVNKRLDSFYHKCHENDLQLYIEGCADILNISIPNDEKERSHLHMSSNLKCKQIIEFMVQELIQYKTAAIQ